MFSLYSHLLFPVRELWLAHIKTTYFTRQWREYPSEWFILSLHSTGPVEQMLPGSDESLDIYICLLVPSQGKGGEWKFRSRQDSKRKYTQISMTRFNLNPIPLSLYLEESALLPLLHLNENFNTLTSEKTYINYYIITFLTLQNQTIKTHYIWIKAPQI